MGKVLIVKTGSTFPSLTSKKGDFEEWVISGMGIDIRDTFVVNVPNDWSFPEYREISGIVITGSHTMVTEHQDWSERTAEWLPAAIDRNIPLLGICYGHQLLAYALGGKVGNNPNGPEFGTVRAKLHTAAKKDRLFGILPDIVDVHVAHTQSVLSLPPRAQLLASSKIDRNQAFVIGSCAWGVQFHPEFDAEIVGEYVHRYRQVLQEKGVAPEVLIQNSRETPCGSVLLKRFCEIVHGYSHRAFD